MPAVIGRTNLKSTSTQGSEPSTVTMMFSKVHLDELMATTVISLQKDVEIKTTEIAGLNNTITGLQQTITTKTAELAQANQSLTALQAQKDIVDAELIAAQNSILQLTSDLDTAEAALTQAQSDLSTANAALAQSQSDLATANANLSTAQSDLSTANASLSTAQSDLATANATITDLQDQLANAPSGGGDVVAEVIAEPINAGNWTFFQGPNSNLLDSYSYDSQTERHNFSINSDVGYVNYHLNNSSATKVHMPRWYKPLFYADGSPVLNTDAFLLQIKIDDMEHPTVSNVALMMGILKIPEALSYLDIAAWGGGGGSLSLTRGNVYAVAGTAGIGSLQATPSSDTVASYKAIGIASGWNKQKMQFSATGWNSPNIKTNTASGMQNTAPSTVYQFDTPDGTQLNLCIWLTTRTNVATPIASTFSAKLSYAVEKW